MQTKTLSERIAELKKTAAHGKEYGEHNLIAPFYLDHALEIIEELEDELETRRAFIVANPCAQCGGKINAMKCGAWKTRAEELEERVRKLEANKL